nr:basic proline-rich protein-like isoform X3 [Anser cygnoides]
MPPAPRCRIPPLCSPAQPCLAPLPQRRDSTELGTSRSPALPNPPGTGPPALPQCPHPPAPWGKLRRVPPPPNTHPRGHSVRTAGARGAEPPPRDAGPVGTQVSPQLSPPRQPQPCGRPSVSSAPPPCPPAAPPLHPRLLSWRWDVVTDGDGASSPRRAARHGRGPPARGQAGMKGFWGEARPQAPPPPRRCGPGVTGTSAPGPGAEQMEAPQRSLQARLRGPPVPLPAPRPAARTPKITGSARGRGGKPSPPSRCLVLGERPPRPSPGTPNAANAAPSPAGGPLVVAPRAPAGRLLTPSRAPKSSGAFRGCSCPFGIPTQGVAAPPGTRSSLHGRPTATPAVPSPSQLGAQPQTSPGRGATTTPSPVRCPGPCSGAAAPV